MAKSLSSKGSLIVGAIIGLSALGGYALGRRKPAPSKARLNLERWKQDVALETVARGDIHNASQQAPGAFYTWAVLANGVLETLPWKTLEEADAHVRATAGIRLASFTFDQAYNLIGGGTSHNEKLDPIYDKIIESYSTTPAPTLVLPPGQS